MWILLKCLGPRVVEQIVPTYGVVCAVRARRKRVETDRHGAVVLSYSLNRIRSENELRIYALRANIPFLERVLN